MRLFEHADFEQAIIQAAEHFRAQGLRPAIIEKDYYVTEALWPDQRGELGSRPRSTVGGGEGQV